MPLPQNGALAWRPSKGTKLYCLVNRGKLAVNNLPRVVARIMPWPESNLQLLDHKSDALPLHYRATSVTYSNSINDSDAYVISLSQNQTVLKNFKKASIRWVLWASSLQMSMNWTTQNNSNDIMSDADSLDTMRNLTTTTQLCLAHRTKQKLTNNK